MIFDTFARRKRMRESGETPEVYIYDVASEQMRYQINLVMLEGIGVFQQNTYGANANEWWNLVNEVCDREIFSYTKEGRVYNSFTRYVNYIEKTLDIEDLLSALEIGCRVLNVVKDKPAHNIETRGAKVSGGDAIDEINARFIQHAFGYQFENGEIMRIDSLVTHQEIVKPALVLLTEKAFSKANDDFMTAHRHYRSGDWKDSVTASNRAFESMLKAICDAESWKYEKGDRATELVSKVSSKGLFTHDFDKSFTAYIAMLKTGLPTVRNDAGGHGESLAASAVTPEIARFALNLTATNICFLGDSYKILKRRK